MASTPIKRAFVDLPHGQVHYRYAGDSGEALLLLHASPGSSRQLVRMIEDCAGQARVFAPDTPGNGDSAPLFEREPSMAELAAATLAFVNAVGLDKVRVYGSHTGAALATELAILAPDHVSALVLDGVSLMHGEELAEVLKRYAHPFEPDLDGAYLMRLFQFCRDQFVFFPWYNRTRAGRRDGGLGNPADLHAWITEVMKANTTYHLNYRAAFKWPADKRLPLVECPTLVTAAINDPLHDSSLQLEKLLPNSSFMALPRLDDAEFRSARKAAMDQFFGKRG